MWNDKPSPGFKFRPRLGIWTDGQNNKFDPDAFEATSYQWWTYVCKINGKVVFNNYPYSNTTQNHQRNMRALLKKLRIKIDVEVSMRQSLSGFYSNSLPTQYAELFKIEVESQRAKKDGVFVECHQKYYKTRAKACEAIRESIKACRQLGAKFSRAEIKALKAEVKAKDVKRLEDARKEAAEVRAKRAALKPQVNDLGPVNLLEVFEQSNDLNEIKLGA